MQDVYYRVIDNNPRYCAGINIAEDVIKFPTQMQLQLLGLLHVQGFSNLQSETDCFTDNYPVSHQRKEEPTRYGPIIMTTLSGMAISKLIAKLREEARRTGNASGISDIIIKEYQLLLMNALGHNGVEINNLSIEAGFIPYSSVFYQLPR